MAYVSIIDFQWFASFLHLFFKITLYIAIRSVTWNIVTSLEQKYALNHFSDPFSFSFFQPPPFLLSAKKNLDFGEKRIRIFSAEMYQKMGMVFCVVHWRNSITLFELFQKIFAIVTRHQCKSSVVLPICLIFRHAII